MARAASTRTNKAHFRALDVPVNTVDKNLVESSGATGGGEVPNLVQPEDAANLYYAEPWFSAACDAIAQGVSTADVFASFQGASPDVQADRAKLAAVAAFLDAQDREMLTIQERLFRLDLDFTLMTFCAIEITRDSKRLPAAWYHVPAVTLRVRRDGSVRQVAGPGRKAQVFKPYQKGGHKDGEPEILLIRRYDPLAQNVGGPQMVPLLGTISRLGMQDAYNNRLLGQGGLPPKIVLLKETLDDESYQRFQTFLQGLASGSKKEVIGILDGVGEGSQIKELLASAVDLAFREGEDQARQRILAKMRVPPTKVSLQAANYATSYQEDASFKFETTQPRLKMYLKRLSVVAQELATPEYVLSFRQQTLEDFLQLVQALNLLLQAGGLTLNQALARAGFPPMGPDGDAHIAFTNQGPVLVSDLAKGGGPPTPGRMIDMLTSLRGLLLQATDGGHEHAAP